MTPLISSSKAPWLVAPLLALAAAACTPTSSYQGFQVVDQNPAEVKVGDAKAAVMAKLGTPTATSSFDKNTWFYMTQVQSKTAFYRPRLARRDVVAIHFAKDGDQVASVNTYTLKDSRIVAYNGRETPTRGREMTVVEQLLGSISPAGILNSQQEVNPGTHGQGP